MKDRVPFCSTELEGETQGQDKLLSRQLESRWLQGPSHPPGKELLTARVHGVAGRVEVGGAEEHGAVPHLCWHIEETWGTRSSVGT